MNTKSVSWPLVKVASPRSRSQFTPSKILFLGDGLSLAHPDLKSWIQRGKNRSFTTFKTFNVWIYHCLIDCTWSSIFQLASVFGGYAACVVIGLLFVIIMPIAGLFFCCCYCCCKRCGKARDKEDPPRAGCKRAAYCFLLAVFATMML